MKQGTMSAFKNDDDFNERLSTAAKAKQALLEKFRARPKADDPAAAERQAARLATSLARVARIAERKAAREAEAARLQAEARSARPPRMPPARSLRRPRGRFRNSPWKPSARPLAMPGTPDARRGSGSGRRPSCWSYSSERD
jgi:Family of unknown function (DUF6481)